MVRSQLRQIDHETLSQKYPSRKRADRVAQSEGPEVKPSTSIPKNKKKNSGRESIFNEGNSS
jgi:hypothetical protein